MHSNENIDKREHFMVLYSPVHDRVYRFIRTTIWNEDDARDILAETAMIAFERFYKLQSDEVFIGFLFGIASRLIKQYQRKKLLWGMFKQSYANNSDGGNSNIEFDMDVQHLIRCLQKIGQKEGEAIILFEIVGLSIKEIQDIQGGSLSAIKSRLQRSRIKLAQIMESTLPEYRNKQADNESRSLYYLASSFDKPIKN